MLVFVVRRHNRYEPPWHRFLMTKIQMHWEKIYLWSRIQPNFSGQRDISHNRITIALVRFDNSCKITTHLNVSVTATQERTIGGCYHSVINYLLHYGVTLVSIDDQTTNTQTTWGVFSVCSVRMKMSAPRSRCQVQNKARRPWRRVWAQACRIQHG